MRSTEAQQGCWNQIVDHIKQRSGPVGYIDPVIYCVASWSFASVWNSNSIVGCWGLALKKETLASINLKRIGSNPLPSCITIAEMTFF